jgi:hypothetical protein
MTTIYLEQYSGIGDDIEAQLKNGGTGNEFVHTGPEGDFKSPLIVYFKSHNDTITANP